MKKFKMLRTGQFISLPAKALSWYKEGLVYESSDQYAREIVEVYEAAEYVDDSTPTAASLQGQHPKTDPKPTTKKKKTRKSKGKVDPLVEAGPTGDPATDEVGDGEV